MSNFTVESILEEFQSKSSQKQGIKCSIKEILSLPYPILQTCAKLLRDLLSALQQEAVSEDLSKYSYRQAEESPQYSAEDRYESVEYPRGSDESAERNQ